MRRISYVFEHRACIIFADNFIYNLGKSQALYEELLRVVVQQCDDLTASADPHTVITDFELAVMNAVANFLGPQVEVQGCLKHK